MPLRVEETGIYYSVVLGSLRFGFLLTEQSDFRKPLKINRLSGNVPGMVLFQANGCSKCDGQGTQGRMAVHEVLIANTHIHRLTMESADTNVIREAAIMNGMIPMIGDGLDKVRQGMTLLDDVQRKIGVSVGD